LWWWPATGTKNRGAVRQKKKEKLAIDKKPKGWVHPDKARCGGGNLGPAQAPWVRPLGAEESKQELLEGDWKNKNRTLERMTPTRCKGREGQRRGRKHPGRSFAKEKSPGNQRKGKDREITHKQGRRPRQSKTKQVNR